VNVIDRVQFGRYSTMYAQELLVQDRREGQGTERLDARLIHALGVLVLTFRLEREVVSQMPALVVSAEEEERVRVANLESP
jgi:hypothetical protein